jgi:hypothetical protein
LPKTKQRRWQYEDQSGIHEFTEDEIVTSHWSYCAKQFEKLKDKPGMELNRERCIEDWIALHWAWEVRD